MSIQSTVSKALGIIMLALLLPSIASADLNDLFGKKELDEGERQQTIDRIENIQEKLKLLQDKLRALERRKAAKEAARRSAEMEGAFAETPVNINWQPIDETVVNPGEYGLYTYLLFSGGTTDTVAIGILEDFILTLETLPANETPASLANRFLVPVEKPQSVINLGRQPFDFELNRAYLDRLGVNDNLPAGPVLVSSTRPIDPYGTGDVMENLAVSLGKQPADRAAKLANVWHAYEKDSVTVSNSMTSLFWQIIDGLGTVRVKRDNQNIMVILNQ